MRILKQPFNPLGGETHTPEQVATIHYLKPFTTAVHTPEQHTPLNSSEGATNSARAAQLIEQLLTGEIGLQDLSSSELAAYIAAETIAAETIAAETIAAETINELQQRLELLEHENNQLWLHVHYPNDKDRRNYLLNRLQQSFEHVANNDDGSEWFTQAWQHYIAGLQTNPEQTHTKGARLTNAP